MDGFMITVLIGIFSLMVAGVLLAYHMGLRDGYSMAKSVPPEKLFPRWKKKEPIGETDEQRKARITAENIENFGTGRPQKEVR